MNYWPAEVTNLAEMRRFADRHGQWDPHATPERTAKKKCYGAQRLGRGITNTDSVARVRAHRQGPGSGMLTDRRWGVAELSTSGDSLRFYSRDQSAPAKKI